MICHECQQAGKTRDAVALCHHCSAALCLEHALIRKRAGSPVEVTQVSERDAVNA